MLSGALKYIQAKHPEPNPNLPVTPRRLLISGCIERHTHKLLGLCWVLLCAGCLQKGGPPKAAPVPVETIEQPAPEEVAEPKSLEPPVSAKTCYQPRKGETRPTISQLTSAPPRRVSPSVRSKNIVLEHCQGYCLPVLEVPIVNSVGLRAQEVLDAAWRQLSLFGQEEACQVFRMGFQVNYDAHELLSVTFRIEYDGGAYSVSVQEEVNLTSDGQRLSPMAIFRVEALPLVVALVDERMQQSIEKNLTSLDEDDRAECEASLKRDNGDEVHFRAENLERFVIKQEGIEFRFDFKFRHAINALAPNGSYLINFEDLYPHLNPRGPFAWMFSKDPSR
ncbi:MAG: hypothetical protein GY847_18600 [Proteobacteria bacterium]|nr:hypothetical protein [Pseudomonadota bacterium]